jgi:hypothetical protein
VKHKNIGDLKANIPKNISFIFTQIVLMIDYCLVYLYSDQPAICSFCGARSFIISDLSHTKTKTKINECLNTNCKYEFILQYDKDFP